MARPVRLSPAARRDLEGIVRYISFDQPQRAERFGMLLLGHARSLAEMPDRGRAVPEFADPQLRELIVQAYRLIYRINPRTDAIELVRIWHAARGTPNLNA